MDEKGEHRDNVKHDYHFISYFFFLSLSKDEFWSSSLVYVFSRAQPGLHMSICPSVRSSLHPFIWWCVVIAREEKCLRALCCIIVSKKWWILNYYISPSFLCGNDYATFLVHIFLETARFFKTAWASVTSVGRSVCPSVRLWRLAFLCRFKSF